MANEVTSFQVQGNKYSVKADLTFDNTPTIGSSNPVTSNGIALAVQGAAVGTDISVGRSDGTPIGYCSIAYGTNNVSAGDYNIVFGTDNISVTDDDNSNAGNIISGKSIQSQSGFENILSGMSHTHFGKWDVVLGQNHNVGTGIKYASINSPSPSWFVKQEIYFGYVDIQNRAIYYDVNHQNRIDVVIQGSTGSTYFVDLTDVGDRKPGDIYRYTKDVNGRVTVYSLSGKLLRPYITFTDWWNNSTFFYKGTCYYDNANDINYTDSTKTSQIYSYSCYDVYFDTNRQEFIAGSYGSFVNGRYPRWAYVTLYPGYRSTIYDIFGRYAYVAHDTSDMDNIGKVYSSPDLNPDSEITHLIEDGEFVCDINGGGLYHYFKNSNGQIRAIIRHKGASTTLERGFNGVGYGNCELVAGSANATPGGVIGGLLVGCNNKVNGGTCESISLIGWGNETNIFPNKLANGGGESNGIGHLLVGNSNAISCYENTNSSGYNGVFGQSAIIGCFNSFYTRGPGDHGYTHIIGEYNEITYQADHVNIIGSYNYMNRASFVEVVGSNNTTSYPNFLSYGSVIGNNNTIGGFVSHGYSIIIQHEDGHYTGEGVSYNSQTGLYTFPTDKIMEMRGISADYSNNIHPKFKGDYVMGYYKSTDGHNLQTVNVTSLNDYYVYNFGYLNNYKKDTVSSGRYNATLLIGDHIDMVCTASSEEVMACGHYIQIDARTQEIDYPVVFTGTYNTVNGTNGAAFVVGNGEYSDRSNGLVVYSTGVTALPSSPDTISGGVNAMTNTGVNSDKMAITYGMLKDYTGPGGGGQVKPSTANITLDENDWSNLEQTVNVTGITTDSIVIVQPIGPTTFGYNNNHVYLSSVNNGSLTFGCATGPSGDITVKVVYWA